MAGDSAANWTGQTGEKKKLAELLVRLKFTQAGMDEYGRAG